MANTGFWWIILACSLYGTIHSLLASLRFKTWVERQVGGTAYRRFYRIFFSLMALVTSLPLLALVWLLPDQMIYIIPVPWRYLTLLVQAIAAGALMIGVLQTGAMRFLGVQQMLVGTVQPGPERLVVRGLYRWVRHPLYSASFVLIWLMPFMTWNLLALNLGLSAYMLIGTIFEEQKLVAQFGPAYEQYRLQTPRILPGIIRQKDTHPPEKSFPGDGR